MYGCVSFGWEKRVRKREREKQSVKKYSGVFFSNNNNWRVLYAYGRKGERTPMRDFILVVCFS
jgi:hypothetical protein